MSIPEPGLREVGDETQTSTGEQDSAIPMADNIALVHGRAPRSMAVFQEETPPKRRCIRLQESPSSLIAPKEVAKVAPMEMKSPSSVAVDCALRAQYFMKGKMKEIKGKGGRKRHKVWLSCEDGVPKLLTDGLSNNLHLHMSNAKQVHTSKEKDKVMMVFETRSMAFYLTVMDADLDGLCNLLCEMRPHLPSTCELDCD